jgi:hypothetical protein
MKSILAATLSLFSALAIAQAPSGKWTGNAAPNMGDPSRCTPNMAFELVAEKGKLTGKLDFGNRIQAIEAAVAADGKFETSFVNPSGHVVNITGKLGDTFTVVNPIRCGYGNIPLKK